MYMWFSCGIIILELVLSIHFNLLKLSSKQSSTCIYHPKKSLMFNCHPIFFIHFVMFIHVHVEKYFPCHSYMAWGYSKNILSLSLKYSKYICSYSQIPAHRLMFTLMCSFHNIVAYHDTHNCTIKVILLHFTPSNMPRKSWSRFISSSWAFSSRHTLAKVNTSNAW